MTEHYDALEDLNNHIRLREKLIAITNLSVNFPPFCISLINDG